MRLLRVRRSTAGAVAVALAAAFVSLPQAAEAAVTSVAFRCVTEAFEVQHEAAVQDYDLDVSSASVVENGATLVIGWKLDRLPDAPPVDLTGVRLRTTVRAEIEVSGDVDVIEKASAVSPLADVPAGSPLPGETDLVLSTQALATTPGDELVVRPAAFTVEYVEGDDGMEGATVECTPVGSVPPLRTVVVQGTPPACLEDDSCGGEQTFVGDPPASALSLNADPDGADASIAFPGVDVSGEKQVVSVDDVTFARVSDRRALPLGWTLSAVLEGPLDATGSSLPASAVRVDDVGCGQTPGAAGSAAVLPGFGGSLDAPVVLCIGLADSVGATGAPGGQWDVAGRVTLDVPAFASAGQYYGVLVLTLV